MTQLAQRTRTGTGGGEWLHYVVDPIVGAPHRLLSDDGSVVAETPLDAWGRAESDGALATPLRFRGQYHDEETGLAYNRYRYYDAELARYVSPDPLGVVADLNPYRYAENRPTAYYDELGLFPTTTYQRPDGSTLTGYSAGARPDGTPVVRDPAIRGAVHNARRAVERRGETPGSTFGRCGEVDALHQRAAEIRAERQRNGTAHRNPRRENAAIRSAIRAELSRGGGARMTTRNSRGQLMNPCASCHQILREMGCHPQNNPSTGARGVIGGDGRPFDGRSDHTGAGVTTSPATTPSLPAMRTTTNAQGQPVQVQEVEGRGRDAARYIPAEQPRDRARERRQGRQ